MTMRDLAEDIREREEAMATWRWWEEHHDELLARYPEQFVAIDKERTVIAAAPGLLALHYVITAQGLDFSEDVDSKFLTANKRWHFSRARSRIDRPHARGRAPVSSPSHAARR